MSTGEHDPRPHHAVHASFGIVETRLRWRLLPIPIPIPIQPRSRGRRPVAARVLTSTWYLEGDVLVCQLSVAPRPPAEIEAAA